MAAEYTGGEIPQTALLNVLTCPADRSARDGSLRGVRRASAFTAILADPEVMRVAELVVREEARGR